MFVFYMDNFFLGVVVCCDYILFCTRYADDVPISLYNPLINEFIVNFWREMFVYKNIMFLFVVLTIISNASVRCFTWMKIILYLIKLWSFLFETIINATNQSATHIDRSRSLYTIPPLFPNVIRKIFVWIIKTLILFEGKQGRLHIFQYIIFYGCLT